MAELSHLENVYIEMRDALKAGKQIVAIEANGIREFVNKVRVFREKNDGTSKYYADTMAGRLEITDKTAVSYFDNVRDAQNWIFGKKAA